MDPNETLRLYWESMSEAYNADDREGQRNAFDDAAHHAKDLFEWLGKGGFAPDWSQF